MNGVRCSCQNCRPTIQVRNALLLKILLRLQWAPGNASSVKLFFSFEEICSNVFNIGVRLVFVQLYILVWWLGAWKEKSMLLNGLDIYPKKICFTYGVGQPNSPATYEQFFCPYCSDSVHPTIKMCVYVYSLPTSTWTTVQDW